MYITVEQTKENGDLSLSYQNGQNLTLRFEPDFDVDNYSLSAITGINGRYETTSSITSSGNYKLFRNGVEDKGFGGNNGKLLISETSLLDANNFNVGETIICADVGGQKVFVPKTASSIPIRTLLILATVNGTQSSYDTLYDDFDGDVIFEKYGDDLDTGMYDINTLGNTDLSKSFISFQTCADSSESYFYRYTLYPLSNLIVMTQYLDKNPTNSPNSFYLKLEVYP